MNNMPEAVKARKSAPKGGGRKGGMRMANKQQISVRFDPDKMEQIKALAKLENRPPANLIAHIVLEYLENRVIQNFSNQEQAQETTQA